MKIINVQLQLHTMQWIYLTDMDKKNHQTTSVVDFNTKVYHNLISILEVKHADRQTHHHYLYLS